ncbi:MAG: hypothetical protein KC550_04815 [Nanoarchaeota archaeon]|nr:hypothetical protein [Nanoarchaeota archaeon]
MNSKIFLIIVIFLTLVSSSFADYTYNNNGWYSYSETLSHGGQTSIKYIVQNTNTLCSMSCSAKVESEIGDSDTLNFDMNAGSGTILTFGISAPTKSQANYKSSGSIDYDIDIDCYEESSFFCDGSKQNGDSLGQTSFKVIYDLSDTDKKNKATIDGVLDDLKNDIQEFNDALYELESLYNNAKSQVLVSNLNSQISSLTSKYNNLKSKADSISNN